eukprot:TRINITY_DN6824_c0_g1_i2.p1 TRINITY_DN6824_c0_g1~~TRINITY_DN6824_c0_g1_i2.p1  ORF type:complete len:174 (+),score=35.07 TRINITY_DN6824_c0_g1_i2:3-524(+)
MQYNAQDSTQDELTVVNPFRGYMEDLIKSVGGLKCVLVGDVHGTTRLHATAKDTEWKSWGYLSSLYSEPEQLEQSLQVADGLPRQLKRTILFLDDYIIVQDAFIHKDSQTPAVNSHPGDWATLTPVVLITLVASATNGEGDVGALIGLLEKLKECPMFKAIATAVIAESENEY